MWLHKNWTATWKSMHLYQDPNSGEKLLPNSVFIYELSLIPLRGSLTQSGLHLCTGWCRGINLSVASTLKERLAEHSPACRASQCCLNLGMCEQFSVGMFCQVSSWHPPKGSLLFSTPPLQTANFYLKWTAAACILPPTSPLRRTSIPCFCICSVPHQPAYEFLGALFAFPSTAAFALGRLWMLLPAPRKHTPTLV